MTMTTNMTMASSRIDLGRAESCIIRLCGYGWVPL